MLLFTVTVNDTIGNIAHNPDVVFNILKQLIPCPALPLCCECTTVYVLWHNFHFFKRTLFCCVCSTVAAERDIVLEVSEHIKPEVKADLLEWVCTHCKEVWYENHLKHLFIVCLQLITLCLDVTCISLRMPV